MRELGQSHFRNQRKMNDMFFYWIESWWLTLIIGLPILGTAIYYGHQAAYKSILARLALSALCACVVTPIGGMRSFVQNQSYSAW